MQTSLGQAMAKEARCPDPATAQPTMRPGDVVGLGPRWLPSLGLIKLEAEIVCIRRVRACANNILCWCYAAPQAVKSMRCTPALAIDNIAFAAL